MLAELLRPPADGPPADVIGPLADVIGLSAYGVRPLADGLLAVGLLAGGLPADVCACWPRRASRTVCRSRPVMPASRRETVR